jgi:hypothetical protein
VLKFLKKFKAAINAKSKLGGNGFTIKNTPRKIFKKFDKKMQKIKTFYYSMDPTSIFYQWGFDRVASQH